MSDAPIDEALSGALERLTANEKECLRRRLSHQTAKEMALELGISPHAVEKRLKMARAKLGLSSSLEAARALEDWERYGRTGPQSPDLATAIPQGKNWFTRPTALGVIAMSLLAATLIVIAQQGVAPLAVGGVAPLDAGGVAPLPPAEAAETAPDGTPITWVEHDESKLVEATPAEILVIVQNTFRVLDKDRSGFIDGEESAMHAQKHGSAVYRRDENGKVAPTGETSVLREEQVRAEFYKRADYDGDGKVTLHEYRLWASPGIAKRGIPAEWKADMNKPIPADPS